MKMVTAFIRTTSLERIIKSLAKIGIRGMTISEIKGIGQQVELFRPYTVHDRIDIIVPDEKVEEVTDKILEHASTGLAGDGHIAVFPLDYTIKIRTMEKRT
jgi:nitrogen regulatory protein P-II 1